MLRKFVILQRFYNVAANEWANTPYFGYLGSNLGCAVKYKMSSKSVTLSTLEKNCEILQRGKQNSASRCDASLLRFAKPKIKFAEVLRRPTRVPMFRTNRLSFSCSSVSTPAMQQILLSWRSRFPVNRNKY